MNTRPQQVATCKMESDEDDNVIVINTKPKVNDFEGGNRSDDEQIKRPVT